MTTDAARAGLEATVSKTASARATRNPGARTFLSAAMFELVSLFGNEKTVLDGELAADGTFLSAAMFELSSLVLDGQLAADRKVRAPGLRGRPFVQIWL